MPVTLSGREQNSPFGLIDNLFTSLQKFSQPNLFDRFFIITPPRDHCLISEHIKKYDFTHIEIINELELVPELKNYVGLIDGWRIQQILKLAISDIIETPYYLTFDQDIFCTHTINEHNLLPEGKALTQYEAKTAHKKWWQSSAYHLNMTTKLDDDGMQVTPAILSSTAATALIRELSTEVNWIDKLLKPHLPNSLSKLHPRWKYRHRWTEYTLYWLYLEKHNLIDKYHTDNTIGYTLLSEQAVWKKEGLIDWNPESCFSVDDKSLFSLVQSSTGITSNFILEKIKKHIS